MGIEWDQSIQVYHLYVPTLQGDPGELGLPGAVGAKVGTEPFTLLCQRLH